MSNVLVFVEQSAGKIKAASLPGISFGQEYAQKTGGSLFLAVAGNNVQPAAQELTSFGAAKVFCIEHPHLEHALAESLTTAVHAAAKACSATMVAAATTSTSKDFLPRLSVRLDAAMASDVLSVVDASTFKRPMWAGNVVATVKLGTAVKVCTVRGTEFGAPKPGAGASAIETLACDLNPSALRTSFVHMKEVKSARPDLTSAKRIVSGGRGVKSPEGFKVIEDLADAIGAGVGASRAVCDAGWVPNDLQIGPTGKVVAPELYIAVGLSGAIQHLAGMKKSKVIVAINKDPEAPIFQVADYGLVADLFKAVPELIEALKR
jgi:electron transfer flavoprotein alpha subunit